MGMQLTFLRSVYFETLLPSSRLFKRQNCLLLWRKRKRFSATNRQEIFKGEKKSAKQKLQNLKITWNSYRFQSSNLHQIQISTCSKVNIPIFTNFRLRSHQHFS